ncbi:MAG: hypothetical protein AAF196_00695 [Planctomycetota bacterium]
MLFPILGYLGPSSVGGSLVAFVALIGTVLLAIVGFLWYPLKRIFGKKSTMEKDDADWQAYEQASDNDDSGSEGAPSP